MKSILQVINLLQSNTSFLLFLSRFFIGDFVIKPPEVEGDTKSEGESCEGPKAKWTAEVGGGEEEEGEGGLGWGGEEEEEGAAWACKPDSCWTA